MTASNVDRRLIPEYDYGMTTTTKVAVTIPRETFARLERARRRAALSRSAAVAQALEAWLGGREPTPEDARYAQAYLRNPEPAKELEALAAAVAATWEPWE